MFKVYWMQVIKRSTFTLRRLLWTTLCTQTIHICKAVIFCATKIAWRSRNQHHSQFLRLVQNRNVDATTSSLSSILQSNVTRDAVTNACRIRNIISTGRTCRLSHSALFNVAARRKWKRMLVKFSKMNKIPRMMESNSIKQYWAPWLKINKKLMKSSPKMNLKMSLYWPMRVYKHSLRSV